MKKVGLIIILSLVFISSLVSVSAYSASYYGNFVADTMNRVIGIVQDFLGPVFAALLGTGNFDEFFFSRILLLIMMFAVVYIALRQVPIFTDKKNSWALFVVAAVVSLFGVRFMAESSLLQMALLPYGVLGVSLTVFLPFLIFFYFLHSAIPNSTLARRLAWGLFAAVFFGLWINRADQFGDYNWIYWLGIGGVALAFIFDPKFHEYFGMKEFKDASIARLEEEITDIEADLDKYGNIKNPSPSVKRTIERLEKRREYLIKARHRA